MPTLNEYANDDGYYILARPSDTGNITYQLKPRGEQIVEKVGYQDGEEIGWQVISALKVPNLVYTGDEGTTEDDISVDLGKEEIDALSEEDAKELLDELSSVPRVGESQEETIKKIFHISTESEPDTDKLAAVIESSLLEQGFMYKELEWEFASEGLTPLPKQTYPESINVVAVDLRDTDTVGRLLIDTVNGVRKEMEFKISIFGRRGKQFDGEAFEIEIGINQNDGIGSFVTKVDENITINCVTKYQKVMSKCLPIIVSGLESVGINPGSPESLPGLKVISRD